MPTNAYCQTHKQTHINKTDFLVYTRSWPFQDNVSQAKICRQGSMVRLLFDLMLETCDFREWFNNSTRCNYSTPQKQLLGCWSAQLKNYDETDREKTPLVGEFREWKDLYNKLPINASCKLQFRSAVMWWGISLEQQLIKSWRGLTKTTEKTATASHLIH